MRVFIDDQKFPAVKKRDGLFFGEHGFLVYPQRSCHVLQRVSDFIFFHVKVPNVPPKHTVTQAG